MNHGEKRCYKNTAEGSWKGHRTDKLEINEKFNCSTKQDN